MKIISYETTRANRGRNMTLVYGAYPFPTGKILVAISARGLCWIGTDTDVRKLKREWPRAELIEDKQVVLKTAREIVKLWPQGLHRFSLPLVLHGTAFQLKVWKALLTIKPGTTVSYQDIARKIGKPKAVRAVGSAVGKNPLSILVPCHRVVNKTGKKINYAGGPALKKALLRGEGVTV